MTPVTDGRLKELLARSDWDTLWYGEFVSIASELLTSRSEIARLTAEVERLRGEWREGWVIRDEDGLYDIGAGDYQTDLQGARVFEEQDDSLLDNYESFVPVRYREREVELIEPTKEPI